MIPIGFIYIKNVTKFTNYACNVQKSENWIHDPIFQKKVFIFYKGGVIMMHATNKILEIGFVTQYFENRLFLTMVT